MTLQQPVVNAGIARTDNLTVQLAAYGVVLSIVVLLESPIQMLLQTATALVVDPHSFRLVRRLMLLAGLSLSGLGLLIAASPLSILVTEGLLGLPPEVGAATRMALWPMLPWPLVVAWRRFYQGVLIGAGRASVVGWATLCRLGVIGLTVAVGLSLTIAPPGALLGSLALVLGAIAEAAAVTWWARPALSGIAGSTSRASGEHLTFAALLSFYAPLATTSAMTILVWPIISSALARGRAPTLGLAAWPIALSVWWLLGTPLQMLQQVVIAALRGGVAGPAVRRFALTIGAAASVLLGIAVLTSLSHLFLTEVIAAPPSLSEAVIASLRVMLPLPILASLQALLQGELIARGMTGQVRTAMAASLAALVLVLFFGTAWRVAAGTLLAATGLVVSSSVEVALLWSTSVRHASRAHDAV